MSTTIVAVTVAAVLVVIAVVAVVAANRRGAGAGRLRHRFGPEYDRALAAHDGDVKATRKALAERVRRYGGLKERPLSETGRERYAARWQAVQAGFVIDPARAVGDADRLIAALAEERGFPTAGSPEHHDALSVHHAGPLQGYRQAHALAEHADAGGRPSTEDLRQALVSARELFDRLLGDGKDAASADSTDSTDATEAAQAPQTEPEPTPAGDDTDDTDDTDEDDDDASAEVPATEATGSRGHGRRFAALTGAGRRDSAGRQER